MILSFNQSILSFIAITQKWKILFLFFIVQFLIVNLVGNSTHLTFVPTISSTSD